MLLPQYSFNSRQLKAIDYNKIILLGLYWAGKYFLDIGSGSGLFSLAAKRLGAKVYSFDYDPKSVRCAEELKKRYYANDNGWVIDEGSILDDK